MAMTCFDCKKMHPKCKAKCCGIVPIPLETWKNNQDKIVTKPIEILEYDEVFIPITNTASCVFLNGDLNCNIYDDRPNICHKFGDESHLLLSCPVLDKEGKERSRQDRRKIERKSEKYMNKLGLFDG